MSSRAPLIDQELRELEPVAGRGRFVDGAGADGTEDRRLSFALRLIEFGRAMSASVAAGVRDACVDVGAGREQDLEQWQWPRIPRGPATIAVERRTLAGARATYSAPANAWRRP